MQELALNRRYRLADSTLCTDLDGEMVLLHCAKETYFSLNRTGTRIWHLLARGATVEELADHIRAHYGIPRDRALSDVAPFLASLESSRLVECVKD